MTSIETGMREQMELRTDLYRDVDDLKYHFQYPTTKQFYETRWKFQEGQLAVTKYLAKEYYEHRYGLKVD